MSRDSTTGSETAIGRLYRRLVALTQPASGLTDEVRAGRNDQIAFLITSMARLPAEGLPDVGTKLAVVGMRLRTEDHSPASPFGFQTLLLLESARDDLARLTAAVAGREREGPPA